MKSTDMVRALRTAINEFDPRVLATLEAAGSEYKKLRAQEAFIAGDTAFAAVLVVWSLAEEQPVSVKVTRCPKPHEPVVPENSTHRD